MSKQTVLFDHQTFEMQKFGGISRYFFELRQKLDCNVKLSLGVTTNHYLKSSGNCPALYLPERPYKWLKGPIKKYNLSVSQKEIRKSDYDIFHPTYYNPYFLDVLPKGKPYVITVHDMNHELFPQYFGNADKMTAWKKETVSNASRIIAINQRTNPDSIYQSIKRLCSDEERRQELINAGLSRVRLFTWEETAKNTLETYQKVINR